MTTNQEYLNAWGSIDSEGNNGDSQKERPEFLKLDIGSTKIRILDMIPYSYKEWWAPRGNGGEGCSIPYFGKDDLLEAENQAHMKKIFAEADKKGLKDKTRKDFLRDYGYRKQPWGKPKEKHIIHVLDRATGEVKLLDKGNAIFKKLKKLALDPEYGDLRQYDVTIVMSGDKNDFASIEYDVTPARQNTPLTEAELKLYEEKRIDLKKFKTPNMTPEQALAIAKGATFKEVLGNGSDSAEEAEEKSSENMLPSEEGVTRKDEDVNIDKEEVLTEEELNNINFG
jgi:hypothetical protein